MDESSIKLQLEQLAEAYAQRDVIVLDKQAAIDVVLTAELKQQLAEVEARFLSHAAAVNAVVAMLEATVKQAVIQHGASVKGPVLHAVYNKGRVTWDTKALDGYVVAHPELLVLRKEGEPSVSLRMVRS